MTSPFDRLSAALVGHYQIEREIGQGGMATVYLAHDVRHDRKVALKVLRPELSAILGGERFLHEIRTTANLQHPHILPLHDSGEADGIVYYVMPFVQGESLRGLLNREKQLPVEDAVRIAREVADALDYAHRHGVVHRDIKPENILLHDGRAQVADFGIALAVSSAGGRTRMTETGMSLGTPHYMSPEQAMGEREISAKSDIYALGCVLYEMLVGEPPFTGPTAQAIIARVVTEEPRSLTVQRRSIPPHIEAVVRKALEKLPADRFASAAQFAAGLSNADLVALPRASGTEQARSARPSRVPGWFGSRLAVVALAVLLVLTAGAAAWGWLHETPSVPAPLARFLLPLPDEARFVDAPGVSIALAPDGGRLAYVGRDETGQISIFLRAMGQLEPVAVPGTRGAIGPFFSPDGLWLAFGVGPRIQKVSLAGGPALTIFSPDSGFYGASWAPSDLIVFSDDIGIKTVPAAGGRPSLVAAIDTTQDVGYGWPHALPDGRTALIQVRGKDNVDRLGVVTLTNGAIKRFDQAGTNPRYISTGHILFGNVDGTIAVVPFDSRRLQITGQAIPVVEGVPVGQLGAAEIGSSLSGALVYASGAGGVRSVVTIDRQGVAQPVSGEPRAYGSPRVSPDGRRVAVDILEAAGMAIWVLDLAQKTLTRLTFHKEAGRPIWSPDGRYIAYTVFDGDPNIFRIRADGSALAESLLVAPGRQLGDAWTPDGTGLLYHQNNASTTRNDIMLLSLDSARTTRAYLQTPADEFAPAISPDGQWVAYSSDESGRVEVYIRSFPEPGGKIQVSLDGGTEPRWSRDGRELFYRNADRMMVASVQLQPEFSVNQRTELFRGQYATYQFHAQYDVTPDGRFVTAQGPQASSDLVVVLNWFDQLRRGGGASSAAGRQ